MASTYIERLYALGAHRKEAFREETLQDEPSSDIAPGKVEPHIGKLGTEHLMGSRIVAPAHYRRNGGPDVAGVFTVSDSILERDVEGVGQGTVPGSQRRTILKPLENFVTLVALKGSPSRRPDLHLDELKALGSPAREAGAETVFRQGL